MKNFRESDLEVNTSRILSKTLSSTFILLSVILLSVGCRKENIDLFTLFPKPKPADFNVSFKMYETYYNGFKVDSDTSVRFAVLFHFEENFSQFKWMIGTEEFYTRDVFLRFGAEQLAEPLPVKLYGKTVYTVNGEKITKEDTATRLLVFKVLENSNQASIQPADKIVRSPYIGRFEGSFTDNTSDRFIITIVDHGNNPQTSSNKAWNVRVYNLPKGCGSGIEFGNCPAPTAFNIANQEYAPELEQGYLSFTADGGGNVKGSCCPSITANGQIINTNRDSIKIECKIRDGQDPVQNRTFLGKKI